MSICNQVKNQYQTIKALTQEYLKALESKNLEQTKILHAKLEQERNVLQEMIWPFEYMSQKELKEQYEEELKGYRELGFLKTLSSGKEGIVDEEGIEHPIFTLQEIKQKLNKNRDFYEEKFATLENPKIHLTPFALSPETMKNRYSNLIEEHFVEAKVDGDKRIPDLQKTRLLGVDRTPLELRTDKQNIYFSEALKDLKYFPKWEKVSGSIKSIGGLTKKQVLEQIGGWRLTIIEDIPLAPEQGKGKLIQKDIKIKGKTKKVKRKQVAGGLNTLQQYELLKEQKEEGFTLEDYLSYAMLYLKKHNIVLDDDRNTAYYCRLLGASTSDGDVPRADWYRDCRQACLDRLVPDFYGSSFGVRGAVRVI